VLLFARDPVPIVLFVMLVAIVAVVLAANVLEWCRTRRAYRASERD
jgi:hypothetical protein